GDHHFNEVVFQDVFLSDATVLGEVGSGWAQVTSELAFERSGPERFLSAFTLCVALVRALGPDPSERGRTPLGRRVADSYTLRRLSGSVAGMLQAGANPAQQAALVKDLGTTLEQEIPEIARLLIEQEPDRDSTRMFAAVLARTMMNAPSFSIRGG